MVVVGTGCKYTSIVTAAAAIASTGGKIFVKNGTYLHDSDSGGIPLPSNCILEGESHAAIIKLDDDVVGSTESGIDLIYNKDGNTGNTNIIIRNLQIDGNGANNAWTGNEGQLFSYAHGRNGVSFRNTQRVLVEGCYIHDTRANAVRALRDSAKITVVNNHIVDCDRGFYSVPGDGSSDDTLAVEEVIVSNNTIENPKVGVYISAFTTNFVVANNTIRGVVPRSTSYGVGIFTDGASMVKPWTITGNSVTLSATGKKGIQVYSGNASYPQAYGTVVGNAVSGGAHASHNNGIDIEECHWVTCIGNSIHDSGDKGIRIVNSDSVTCQGNTIYDCNGVGITAEASDEVVITGNQIEDAGGNGIQVLDTSTNLVVSNNRIYNPTTDGISTGADGIYQNNSIDTAGRYGIYANGVSNSNLSGNTVKSCTNFGIYVRGCTYCSFNNSHVMNGVVSGIYLQDSSGGTASTYNTFIGCILCDDQGTPTQDYGYREHDSDQNYNNVSHCIAKDNVTGEISTQGANDVVQDNITA